ncbi:MAG: AAA family ATPase [Acidobacteriota bacterium]
MAHPSFREIDLRYGCHCRSFTFPEKADPLVIAGPNGMGKTTLVEALVRALFGFDHRRDEERELLEARRPWNGEMPWTKIQVTDKAGKAWWIERELQGSVASPTPPCAPSYCKPPLAATSRLTRRWHESSPLVSS